MANPTCPTDCNDIVPDFVFDTCVPVVKQGQIAEVFIGQKDTPFTDWTLPAEWAARLAATDGTKITRIKGTGSKPKAAATVLDISGKRKVVVNRVHTLPFIIDETSKANYDAMREMQCSGNYSLWYLTCDGEMFGGNEGLPVFIDIAEIIPESDEELQTIDAAIEWKDKFSPECIASPI